MGEITFTSPGRFRNYLEMTDYFANPENSRSYLIAMRWPDGVRCIHCDHDKVYELKGRYRRFKCAGCRKQFSITQGTIFEKSPIPLRKWFVAIYQLLIHKKGISSIQLGKDIGVTQKTAWFMTQRIRHALFVEGSIEKPKLSGTVEIDETLLGGRLTNMHLSKRKRLRDSAGGTSFAGQGAIRFRIPVIGAVQRSGEVRVQYIEDIRKEQVRPFIEKHIDKQSEIMSDEAGIYYYLKNEHEHKVVRHGRKEYVNGNIYTNTIEGFWSCLKKGVFGTYHQISRHHTPLYLEEFSFKYNHRKLTTEQHFNKIVSLSKAKIRYKTLTQHGQRTIRTKKGR